MSDNHDQIKRICEMEDRLDVAKAAVESLAEALDQYESIEDDLFQLINYYSSTLWMQDYEDDEAGKVPAEIKRGVLSEDAVYDLITDHKELMLRMQKAVLAAMENDWLSVK